MQQTTTVTQYEDKVHLHDLHAKILHLLGLDQERLTFLRQVRDFHLTDVHGEVAQGKVNRRDADLHSFQSSLDLVASPGMAEMSGEMQTDASFAIFFLQSVASTSATWTPPFDASVSSPPRRIADG